MTRGLPAGFAVVRGLTGLFPLSDGIRLYLTGPQARPTGKDVYPCSGFVTCSALKTAKHPGRLLGPPI